MEIDNFKDIVKLRSKKLANGTESLYLDVYLEGKRKYEYLRLYILPGKENKAKNKQTLAIANAVKAKRTVEIQNGRFGFEKKDEPDITLIEWIKSYREGLKERKSAGYANALINLVSHIVNYTKGKDLRLVDVDKKFVMGFLRYLKRTDVLRGSGKLAESTAYMYYMQLVIALNRAVKVGYIERNPFDTIPSEDKPKQKTGQRCYLTIEEVKMLIDTDIRDGRIKNAFMFSCFTGLRYSDIETIRWKNIVEVENGVFHWELIQQKTKEIITVPLSENALRWLPESEGRSPEEIIFPMPARISVGERLKKWVKAAGINKRVTFHVARHTYATLLLYYGADLYTVSKLLGHTNIKTTQVYAKVMDESKRKAVNLIPQI